jgi:hypothetical protein
MNVSYMREALLDGALIVLSICNHLYFNGGSVLQCFLILTQHFLCCDAKMWHWYHTLNMTRYTIMWEYNVLQILTIYITGNNLTSYICLKRTRGSVCVAHLSDQLEIRIAHPSSVIFSYFDLFLWNCLGKWTKAL